MILAGETLLPLRRQEERRQIASVSYRCVYKKTPFMSLPLTGSQVQKEPPPSARRLPGTLTSSHLGPWPHRQPLPYHELRGGHRLCARSRDGDDAVVGTGHEHPPLADLDPCARGQLQLLEGLAVAAEYGADEGVRYGDLDRGGGRGQRRGGAAVHSPRARTQGGGQVRGGLGGWGGGGRRRGRPPASASAAARILAEILALLLLRLRLPGQGRVQCPMARAGELHRRELVGGQQRQADGRRRRGGRSAAPPSLGSVSPSAPLGGRLGQDVYRLLLPPPVLLRGGRRRQRRRREVVAVRGLPEGRQRRRERHDRGGGRHHDRRGRRRRGDEAQRAGPTAATSPRWWWWW